MASKRYEFLDTQVPFHPEKLSDGLHLYLKLGDGSQILAQVKSGKVVGWVGRDANKQKLPTTILRQSVAPAGKIPIKRSWGVSCWLCITHNDGTWTTEVCHRIECPQ